MKPPVFLWPLGIFILVVGIRALWYGIIVVPRKFRHPNEPWLWRHEWATRQIGDSLSRSILLLWLLAAFVNAGVYLLVVQYYKHPGRNLSPFVLCAILFAVSLIFLIPAILETLRRMRFGRSVFELQTLPASPGEALKGTIRISRPLIYREEITLRLACYEQMQTGGKRGQQERLLWENHSALGEIAPGTPVAAIPVCIEIPSDAASTDNVSMVRIRWQLEARGKTAGLRYYATFLVPVFRPRVGPNVSTDI